MRQRVRCCQPIGQKSKSKRSVEDDHGKVSGFVDGRVIVRVAEL
jgi:hypothetical protein